MNEVLSEIIETPWPLLTEKTRKIREKHFGREVETCMITNAKCGLCANDCAFCSQSVHVNTHIHTHPLHSEQTLLRSVNEAIDSGVGYFGIVTSGSTVSDEEVDRITRVVSQIAKSGKIHICASLGQISLDSMKKLRDAGLSRLHHNLETSENFYPRVCTTQKWRNRYTTVQNAMHVGFEVCSGGIFGIGESWQDRMDLAQVLKELGVTSVPINFLYPHPGTPLANQPILSSNEALRIIALFRIVLPDTSLRVCGGRPNTLKNIQSQIFAAGANALMTGHYLTTSGITPQTDRCMIENSGWAWK
ncbi:MAG: biotin synthase BioB [Thermoguttaceae bacterium]|nr:biotin synthase BioB [Thermoguttaceae bacterium]